MIDEQFLSEDAAISKSSGDKFNLGTKVAANEGFAGASAANKEAFVDAAAADQNQLSAAVSLSIEAVSK